MNLSTLTPTEARRMIRYKDITQATSGIAHGFIQANVVILPERYAYDFVKFCHRNPKSCPLLDISETGATSFPDFAPHADIRYDVGRYRVYRYGTFVEEIDHIAHLYTKDMVSFLIGCSFSFEHALLQAGIPVRHIEEGHNVPMYVTNIPTKPAGIFHGPVTVSMRPMTPTQAIRATEITNHYRATHGTPIHLGDPQTIGIANLSQPDFGEPVTLREGEVPVFWGCGVTPQSVALQTKPELVITHAPGHMFITDKQEIHLKN
ncbi:putative hydro-lyase [Staphylococcus sp. 17KM0847]|uniref:putative hydro-lyase n=1 Tax=Staphylococcus sp. 17KM0847 TaxID=2583989 RepID=UPI0015DC27ED|nr:putative hydro-lyase [Staphylococcus sp. 17KM0847]QLK86787.1 putative hydro-lyase [Staphylococcus sp. 17KM0847]